MEVKLFTLLPTPKPRWKSFFAGWCVQAISVLGLFLVGARVHQEINSDRPFRVTNLVAYEPVVLNEPQPVIKPALARPEPREIKPAKIEPPVETTPPVAALVVTPQIRSTVTNKAPQAEVAAPQLKVESKIPVMPTAPPSAIVAVGTFSSGKTSTASPTKATASVQAGGFGDENGVPASNHSGVANINAKGSFDLPAGSGHGGGSAGGGTGLIAQSGFGNPVVSGTPKNAAFVKPTTGSNAPVEITFKPKPDYTDEGRKERINGEVRLQVLFSVDGRVHVVRVVQGLGYGLDEQAVKAAEQIKFKPALHEGQPVDSTALIYIVFELIS